MLEHIIQSGTRVDKIFKIWYYKEVNMEKLKFEEHVNSIKEKLYENIEEENEEFPPSISNRNKGIVEGTHRVLTLNCKK